MDPGKLIFCIVRREGVKSNGSLLFTVLNNLYFQSKHPLALFTGQSVRIKRLAPAVFNVTTDTHSQTHTESQAFAVSPCSLARSDNMSARLCLGGAMCIWADTP